MRKVVIFFVCFVVLFVQSSKSQETRTIILNPSSSIGFPEKDKNGCFLASASVVESEKPSDLASLIVYGFRGLFGKNKIVNVHYNYPARIEELTLNRYEITRNCEDRVIKSCSDSPKSIEVKALARDAENDVVVYDYKVSGGKIIGVGANVTWDLSGVFPGTYTITACVDDGWNCQNSITRKIIVISCGEGCGIFDPVCPVVTITANRAGIKENETVTFTAELSGENSSLTPNFKWSVTSGEIISGQNTSTVTVKATPGTAGKSITAVVDTGIPCLGSYNQFKTVEVF